MDEFYPFFLISLKIKGNINLIKSIIKNRSFVCTIHYRYFYLTLRFNRNRVKLIWRNALQEGVFYCDEND